jgi:hypothetical protein
VDFLNNLSIFASSCEGLAPRHLQPCHPYVYVEDIRHAPRRCRRSTHTGHDRQHAASSRPSGHGCTPCAGQGYNAFFLEIRPISEYLLAPALTAQATPK